MSLPYSTIIPATAIVDSPAFAIEKKHLLLAMVNSLIPSSSAYLEFGGAGAVNDFGKYFGQGVKEYAQIKKYFGFLSKSGNAPEKLIVARWYKDDASAFIKGSKLKTSLTSLKAVSDGSFTLSLDGTTQEVTGIDFSQAVSLSDVADTIQIALSEAWESASVTYSSVTGGFIITSGVKGSASVVDGVTAGKTGTDVSSMLGLADAELSQGVNAETFAQFCDRIYHANTSGYAITTLEELKEEDIVPAVEWLNSSVDNQSIYTANKLVFNMFDKTEAKALSSTLSAMDYTGYVITYDPYKEYVNILDCAIGATIDYEVENGSINFNFQPAVGYTSITTLGSVVDYQNGLTNSSLIEELNSHYISCVYSIGFGSNEKNFYGFGLMAGSFGTEDIQINESALEKDIQVSILNALSSLNKVKLRGKDAEAMVSSLLSAPLDKYKRNGSIALNGKLSDADKISIVNVTGNSSSAEAVEENGYYFKIMELTADDVAKRQVRVVICYLAGGVVNKVRIINRIYGA